jgi:site-specific recombinase XerD
MKAWTLCSCLAPQIEAFIRLRQLSGTDYQSQAQLLGYFDRFLYEQDFQQPRLTREICDLYQQNLARLAPRSQGNRFCVVRQLCEYLTCKDPQCFIPEPLRSPPSPGAHRPYIFAPEQIGKLLSAAAKLLPPESLRPHTYQTLIGLLYTTGIRIGEAFALNIEHFLPDEQRLYIAQGKFRKSRWVVLSHSTSRALAQYLDRRMGKKPNAQDAALFLNERRQRLCHPTVHKTYCDLLQKCGIMHDKCKGPRIHDLRHSFAVRRLLAWYRDGEDVNARLPSLATYMGHVDISSTQVYLQPTAELLGEVDRRFHDHYLKHLASKGSRS